MVVIMGAKGGREQKKYENHNSLARKLTHKM